MANLTTSNSAQDRYAAIMATYRVRRAQGASLYQEASASLAYRDIVDGITAPEDYPAVAARFTAMADELGAPVIA